MTKATMKNLNAYLDTISSDFTIERGNGYFYFSWKEGSTADSTPKSIHVCYLIHCDLIKWKELILSCIDDYNLTKEKNDDK
jgi:hypothetical protein